MYNPVVGRWISRDPISDVTNPQIVYTHEYVAEQLQRDHVYAYARNNPVKYIDPSGLHVAICSLEFAGPTGRGPQRSWFPTRNRNEVMTVVTNYGVVIDEEQCGTIEFGVTVSAFSRNKCQTGSKRLINNAGGVDKTKPVAKLMVQSPGRKCTARPWQHNKMSSDLTTQKCPSLRTVVECPIPCKADNTCPLSIDGDIVLTWQIGRTVQPLGLLVRGAYFVPEQDKTKVKCCKIAECEIKMIMRPQRT